MTLRTKIALPGLLLICAVFIFACSMVDTFTSDSPGPYSPRVYTLAAETVEAEIARQAAATEQAEIIRQEADSFSTNNPAGGSSPRIVLQRLEVNYLGMDGKKVIGSGCPGDYGRGTIVDHHIVVNGVDPSKKINRIVVAGDNSTLTWALPCTDNWELAAKESGIGRWDIMIAPSEPARIFTILFFYDDNSIAMGMTSVP